MPRLIEIRDNLQARITEAEHYGWLGEIAGLQATLTAAKQKLDTMRELAKQHPTTHLGMPDFRSIVGRAANDRTEQTPGPGRGRRVGQGSGRIRQR